MIENILHQDPFRFDNKNSLFVDEINKLTMYHYNNCKQYKIILDTLNFSPSKNYPLNEIPYLPVRIFKDYDLMSIPEKDIFKIIRSSGTSGQSFSKIYLDKSNAQQQTKVLAKLVSTILGNKRLPMLVIDCPSTLKNRKNFSARAAGIIGFSVFGKKPVFALNDDMELDIESIVKFFEEFRNEKVFIFGFTFSLY